MNLKDRWLASATFAPEGAGGAAVSTPAPAPSPTPTPAPSPEPGGDVGGGDDFSGFGSDEFEVEVSEQASEPGPASGGDVVVPPVPVATPAAAPAPTPAPAPEPAPAPAPAPEPQKAAPSPSDVKGILEGIAANSEALLGHLAQNVFALSKEQAEAFETDAIHEVPKMMAKVHLEATKNTLNLINQIVPRLIAEGVERISGAKTKASEALAEFYSANPHLNEKDHGAAITKWANAYRAANPKASRKEAIDYVGRAVSLEFGLTPGAPAPRRAAPFAPARQGARTPIQVQEPESPFAGLGQDFEDE